MYENLRPTKMIKYLEEELEKVPEHREGKNTRYELVDAAMAAFSVFYVQSPSFLAAQRDLKTLKGRSNVEKLFGLREIPSDNQIRNLLDPLEPGWVDCPFTPTSMAHIISYAKHSHRLSPVGNRAL